MTHPRERNRWQIMGAALLVTATCLLVAFTLAHQAPLPHTARGTASPAAKTSDAAVKVEGMVVYGHSMPAGAGASSLDLGYAVLAAKALGLPLRNLSYGGDTSDVTASIAEGTPPKSSDVVVVHTGMNDILLRGATAVDQGRAQVQRILTSTSGAAKVVVVLECHPLTWVHAAPFNKGSEAIWTDWNSMVRNVASGRTGVTLLDTCTTWNRGLFNDVDGYHPNDAGHQLIAHELVAALT